MTQDSTLRGIKQVYLNYQTTENAVSQSVATSIGSFLNLELRKTGIRIVRDPNELNLTEDAILNVSILKTSRTLSTWAQAQQVDDMEVRIDVEQMAILQRTSQLLRMVTWYYEESRLGVIPDEVAEGMVEKGLNTFLSAWLDMNDR